MNNKKIFIFTDLDGSILNRENFKFDEIINFIKECDNEGIVIIPNSSKTKIEIQNFCFDINLNLPFISENGSAIHNVNLLNFDLPSEIILSRKKEEIINIFNQNISKRHKVKCKFVQDMALCEQIKVLGLSAGKIKDALNRSYSYPLIFTGNIEDKLELSKNISDLGLKLHEGDRLLNLGDKVAKGTAMKKFVSLMNIKNILTIAVGDSKNDIDMLDASDFPCLVYNKLTQLNDIDTERYFISNSEAPLGWAEVVKRVLNNLKGD